jgi:hypothetical protein
MRVQGLLSIASAKHSLFPIVTIDAGMCGSEAWQLLSDDLLIEPTKGDARLHVNQPRPGPPIHSITVDERVGQKTGRVGRKATKRPASASLYLSPFTWPHSRPHADVRAVEPYGPV